jgi:hypothetical protein
MVVDSYHLYNLVVQVHVFDLHLVMVVTLAAAVPAEMRITLVALLQ